MDACQISYNHRRPNQALGGRTLAGFGRDSPVAEVISLAEVRRRRLVRWSFAHGLLNTYELVDDCESGSTAAAA